MKQLISRNLHSPSPVVPAGRLKRRTAIRNVIGDFLFRAGWAHDRLEHTDKRGVPRVSWIIAASSEGQL